MLSFFIPLLSILLVACLLRAGKRLDGQLVLARILERRTRRDEGGQALVEYLVFAVVTAVIILAIYLVLRQLGLDVVDIVRTKIEEVAA